MENMKTELTYLLPEEKGTKAQSTKEPRVEKIIELWKKKSANVILKKKREK